MTWRRQKPADDLWRCGDSQVGVGDRAARLQQLLAATRLTALGAADAAVLSGGEAAATTAAHAAASLTILVLTAHLPGMSPSGASAVRGALWAMRGPSKQGGSGEAAAVVTAEAAEAVVAAVARCGCGPLQALAQSLVRPLFVALVAATAAEAAEEEQTVSRRSAKRPRREQQAAAVVSVEVEETEVEVGGARAERLRAQGQAWALLGLLRFALVLPAGVADPAARAAWELHHARSCLHESVAPILAVATWERRTVGGAGAAASLRAAAATAEAATLEVQMSELQRQRVERPAQSQFHQLRDDVRRLHEGIASPQKLHALLGNLAAGGEAASREAAVWQDSALHWVRQMDTRYASYRDVLQPLQLAVFEMKHGVALATAAAAEAAHAAAQTAPGQSPLVTAACALMAFPSPPPRAPSTASGAASGAEGEDDRGSVAAQLVSERWVRALTTAAKDAAAAALAATRDVGSADDAAAGG